MIYEICDGSVWDFIQANSRMLWQTVMCGSCCRRQLDQITSGAEECEREQ